MKVCVGGGEEKKKVSLESQPRNMKRKSREGKKSVSTNLDGQTNPKREKEDAVGLENWHPGNRIPNSCVPMEGKKGLKTSPEGKPKVEKKKKKRVRLGETRKEKDENARVKARTRCG